MMLKGFSRGNGKFGIRNKIIVLATVCCVNSIVGKIAMMEKGAVPITHQHGCDHIGKDREQVLRTLSGICNNPNVGGVLLVGLGCENVGVGDIVARMEKSNRAIRSIIVQEIGSLTNLYCTAKKHLSEITHEVTSQKRESFDASRLIVGLNCGASDPMSGITANPAVGMVSDRLVSVGATVILGEITEMIGAEEALSGKIDDAGTRERLANRIASYVRVSNEQGCGLLGVNPTPGNVKAGISSIEEKSLGCIYKAGISRIRGFVEYAENPKSNGLVIMDTPGNDPESVSGIVAGGAHVVLFTTGLGTPLGSPVAPIIKIASNNKVFKHMEDFLDINAGGIVEGASTASVADGIYAYLLDVCNGKETKSEVNGCEEFAINRILPTF